MMDGFVGWPDPETWKVIKIKRGYLNDLVK